MKKVLAFVLSFLVVFLLGIGLEVLLPTIQWWTFVYLGDPHFPSLTEWLFANFGESEGNGSGFGNGSALCLFMLPWSLLLLYHLWPRRQSSPTEYLSWVCFLLGEALLFVVFALICALPFARVLQGMDKPMPWLVSEHIPHLLLMTVGVAIVVALSVRVVRKWRNR